MDRSKTKWIVPLVLGATVIVALAVFKRGDNAEQEPANQTNVVASVEQSKPVADGAQAVSMAISCPGHQLQVAMADDIETVCMGTLIMKHNGSVRSHQVQTLMTPRRWLRVEVAGDTILSAAWGGEERPDFHCQGAECKGITIGRRDALGARVLTLERTSLNRTHSNATAASLQLSGRLEIPPEMPDLACVGQSVSIVTSDSSAQTFCPRGGAGFEIGDDGAMRYRFTSLDGESIVVATDQNHAIRRVQYEGEISLACQSFECGGVQFSAANAEGSRRFTFAGTTLIDTDSGQRNAVLNGTLILPPL